MPTKRIQCDEPIFRQSNDCADNRLRGIVDLVAANSNWGQPLPPRQGRGIAAHRTFTFKEGRTEQSNYIDYLVARTDITPQTNVYFVENDHRPGGVGEPGEPPTGPAICNAINAATGMRIRALPVDPQLLKRYSRPLTMNCSSTSFQMIARTIRPFTAAAARLTVVAGVPSL